MTKKRWIGVLTAVVILLVFSAALVLGCGGESEQVSRAEGDETLWYEAGSEDRKSVV